ncbi:hypothetical protein [Massilia phosphatilytica]
MVVGAIHHAGKVNEIALALAGAILWRKNDDEPIKVMMREGETDQRALGPYRAEALCVLI